jgi:hypothetical protein
MGYVYNSNDTGHEVKGSPFNSESLLFFNFCPTTTWKPGTYLFFVNA